MPTFGLCRCGRRNVCAREDSDRRCRHNLRASSQARKTSGGWYRPGGLASGRVLIEGSFFEVEVGELWRDYAGVDAGFQEPHGGGVVQYVCGDLLFADARAMTGGDASVG